MLYLIITTIGDIAFENYMKLEEGYQYDIPFDNLMLPYIPIADILRKDGLITEDVKVGFAHPVGYRGLCHMSKELLKNRPGVAPFIKMQFTNDRTEKKNGMRIRSIKAGKRFFATVLIPPDLEEEFEKKVTGRKRIGITAEGITGEVEMRLLNELPDYHEKKNLSSLAHYASIDYSVTLLTPTCFQAPYEEGEKTYLYIPGAVVAAFVRSCLKDKYVADMGSIRCSNAYISEGKARLLPVPICDAVIKLDKKQLRYRLASGKDPERVEQEVGLSAAYAHSFEGNLLKYTTPETEHIAVKDKGMFDALSPGQTFCGRIYADDSIIRKIAVYINQNPYAFLGKLTREGYGEVLLNVTGINEAEIPAELPARTFDVCCVSDTLILNDDGLASCKAEDLVNEIEYILKCPGRLVIERRYTNIYRDYSENLRWGADGAVVRCIEKGSVLRIRTTDGDPIDIFPLMNCFVGERTEDGYGELLAYPARGQYYRYAEKMPVSLYERDHSLSFRDISVGADFAENVIKSVLKSRIEALAITDRAEKKNGAAIEDFFPEELIREMKERLLPDISEETLKMWYMEVLEGK